MLLTLFPNSLPILATANEFLPDTSAYATIGLVIGVLMAAIIAVGGVCAAIAGAFALLDRLRGPVKVSARTEPSDTPPGRVEFDLQITALREDVLEVKNGQSALLARLEHFGGDQYRARGRMHHRMNTLENAMHFWAGKLAGQGDPDAERLAGILESQKNEGDDV